MLKPEIPDGAMGLPPKNTLLPKNLDIVGEDDSTVPKLVHEWKGDTEVWFLKDNKFKRPKAIVKVKIYPKAGLLQELGLSVNGRVITELWVAVVKEHLREFNYMAEMASLELDFTVNHDGITLEFSGFNDSLATFVDQALEQIGHLEKLEDKALDLLFAQAKEKLSQDWHNFYFEQSYRQAAAFFENLVLSPAYEKKQLKAILDAMTFEEFASRVRKEHWLTRGRCIWFVHGNLTQETTVHIVTRGRELLFGKAEVPPTKREDLPDIRCIALRGGSWNRVERPLEDRDNENSCLVTYYEAGSYLSDLKKKMVHQVVMQYLEEPTFNQLRTIE